MNDGLKKGVRRVRGLRKSAASIALILAWGVGDAGEMFDFGPLCSSDGCGSAEMDITIASNTLTLVLNNTSPLTLDDGTGVNTPGITGFGFNLADPVLGIVSWSLTAFDLDGNSVVIDNQTGTGDWIMNTTIGNVTLDYLPTTVGGVAGALYNPLATTGFATTPNYETAATLVVEFDNAPVLAPELCGNLGDCQTFVRMQNVGLNGAGSLKIPGTSSTGGTSSSGTKSSSGTGVPAPATFSLLGLGLVGALFSYRRQRAQHRAA